MQSIKKSYESQDFSSHLTSGHLIARKKLVVQCNIQQILEKVKKHNSSVVIVDFFRHGTTSYLEHTLTDKEKSDLDGKYPHDLTPKGEQEVRETAEKIVQWIDPKKDVVVLWSSPAWRAQWSETILAELLQEKWVEIRKDSSVSSMRNFDQKDRGYMDNLWKEIAPIGIAPEIHYACEPELQMPNERFETQTEVKKRAERVFHQIQFLVKRLNLWWKRLRILGVSHFEFINPIAEDVFWIKTAEGEWIKKWEWLTICFEYNKKSKQMEISADFRGVHKKWIFFDAHTRKFISQL